MEGPLNNLLKLKEVLEGMSPPKIGFKRVFRGQSRNFPKMLSNTCRPNATTKRILWKLALNSIPEIRSLYEVSGESGIEEIFNFSVWFEAFIQQYGPGSPYLDVTSSVEVALWFALNEVEITDQEFRIQTTGHPMFSLHFPTMCFIPKVEGTVWLYVMDLPIWNGVKLPQHGEFVDLLEGPELVSSSARIKRQQGGLAYGDIKTDEGDLSSFYACDPIEISAVISGLEIAAKKFQYFFPEHKDDIWFKLLSKAPLVPHLDQNSGFSYKQSLEVYFVTDSTEVHDAISTFHYQTEKVSYPIRSILRTYPDILREMGLSSLMKPEDATYIQVDVPLLSTLHPIEMWNQSALHYGLSKQVRPHLFNDTRKLAFISLENVIIEFSPLDTAFYSSDEVKPITAVWLTIENNNYHCRYFAKHDDDFSFQSFALTFSYSVEDGVFEIKGDKNIPILESGAPKALVKYFLISLYLLRTLSPVLKPDPFCYMILGKIGMVPIRGDSVKLVRSKKDPMDMRLHFLMDSKSKTTYFGPTFEHDASTILSIEPADIFPSLKTIKDIYGHTHKMSYPSAGLPERSSNGFDADIADYVLNIISQLQQHPEYIIGHKKDLS